MVYSWDGSRWTRIPGRDFWLQNSEATYPDDRFSRLTVMYAASLARRGGHCHLGADLWMEVGLGGRATVGYSWIERNENKLGVLFLAFLASGSAP